MLLRRPLVDVGETPVEALFCFAAALGLLWFHLSVSLASQLALIWLTPLALVGVFFLSRPLFLAVLLVSILFQNLLLSFHADLVGDPTSFQILLGSNFLFAALGGALAAVRLTKAALTPAARRTLWLALLFLLATALYAGYGAVESSAVSASIYFRFNVFGPLLLLCGLYLGLRVGRGFFLHLLTFAGVALVLLGLLELFFPLETYSFFRAGDYLALKFPDKFELHDAAGLIEATTRRWLNLSGAVGPAFETLRLQGPALHPISYAYFLAFTALALAFFGQRLLPLMLAALLLFVGGKGALVYLALPFAAYGVYVMTGNVRLFLAALFVLLLAYIGGIMAYGLMTRDLHVLGLIAGVEGLLLHPFGHGVGVGGNMSDLARAERDSALFRQEGAPFALESAAGVLVYQMGIGAALLFGLVALLGRQLAALAKAEPRALLLLAGLLTLFANSLFQEEAFSPAGWGLLMLFIGFILTSASENDELLHA